MPKMPPLVFADWQPIVNRVLTLKAQCMQQGIYGPWILNLGTKFQDLLRRKLCINEGEESLYRSLEERLLLIPDIEDVIINVTVQSDAILLTP